MIINCLVRLDFVWIFQKPAFLIPAVSVIVDVFPLIVRKKRNGKWEGRSSPMTMCAEILHKKFKPLSPHILRMYI